jgi:hypothetical protein
LGKYFAVPLRTVSLLLELGFARTSLQEAAIGLPRWMHAATTLHNRVTKKKHMRYKGLPRWRLILMLLNRKRHRLMRKRLFVS